MRVSGMPGKQIKYRDLIAHDSPWLTFKLCAEY